MTTEYYIRLLIIFQAGSIASGTIEEAWHLPTASTTYMCTNTNPPDRSTIYSFALALWFTS